MGWSGDVHHIKHTLGVVDADKKDGEFIITGEPVFMFMGIGPDCVVSDRVMYLKDGKECPLAPLMNSTSYGLRGVHVISANMEVKEDGK